MVLPKTPEIRQLEEEQTQPRRQGAAVGAAAGGVLDILIGLATFAIPGLEPELLAVGPIVAALADAATGGTVGIIAGTLLGLRLPDDYAKTYEDTLCRGGALVSVHSDNDKKRKQARKIFEANGVENIAGDSDRWDGAAAVQKNVLTPDRTTPLGRGYSGLFCEIGRLSAGDSDAIHSLIIC